MSWAGIIVSIIDTLILSRRPLKHSGFLAVEIYDEAKQILAAKVSPAISFQLKRNYEFESTTKIFDKFRTLRHGSHTEYGFVFFAP